MNSADRNYVAEAQALESSIEQMEAELGSFHIDLFDPLMSEARLHLQAGDREAALDNFRRAQNIVHRNEGVYSPRQLTIIRRLTNLALADGDFEQADQLQRFTFFVQRHNLNEDDPQLMVVYSDMADWYMTTGQPRRARRLLAEALEIARANDLNTLPIAARISKSSRLEGLCCRTTELEQAIAANGSSDPDTLAAAYMELADAELLSGDEDTAHEYYRQAHTISPLSVTVEPSPISSKRAILDDRFTRREVYKIERDPLYRLRPRRIWENDLLEDLALPPQYFIIDGDNEQVGFVHPDIRAGEHRHTEAKQLVGFPLLFNQEQLDNLLSRRHGSRKEELLIELTFDVMTDGNLENIEIAESNAPYKLNRLVINALKRVYFRPALVDGIPVRTEQFRMEQNFRTYLREVQE